MLPNANDFPSSGLSMGLLWALWNRLTNPSTAFFLFDYLPLDHYKLLSNLALKKGCDFEDSGTNNDAVPSVLFSAILRRGRSSALNERDMRSIDMINTLVDYGCCIEQKNCNGRTPLLFAASRFRRKGGVNSIRALLHRRANPHEIDNTGGGALHVVLWSTEIKRRATDILAIHNITVWDLDDSSFQLEDVAFEPQEHTNNLPLSFHEDLETTELRSDAADGSGVHFQFGDHPAGRAHEDKNDRNDDCSGTEGSSDEDCNGEGSDSDDEDCDDNGSDGDDCYGEMIRGINKWLWIDLNLEPREKLYRLFQLRLRNTLFELLQIGCDPNLLDFKGRPPSYYAQRTNVWRHWIWALKHTGYVYEESTDSWVKPSQFDEMLKAMNTAPSPTTEDRSGPDIWG